MGAGNKLNPAMMEVSDIYKTSVCPLARVMRRELKKRHIKHCKVVYSKEKAIQPSLDLESQIRRVLKKLLDNQFFQTSVLLDGIFLRQW